MWGVLVLSGLVHIVQAEFFHEPSRTELRSSSALKTSDFGFSMAYQDSPPRLVVGAPQQDYVGKVYNCPLTDLSKDVDCSKIDMSYLNIEENTLKARQESNVDQKYFFGSSIAATSDYFLTCSPLLPKYIKLLRRGKTITFLMFGACYLYDSKTKTFTEWKDSVVNLQNMINIKKNIPLSTISKNTKTIEAGGLGWNTLADTDNGFMLVAKSAYPVHVLSVPTNTPLAESTSIFNKYYTNHCTSLLQLINTGYGMAVGNFFDKSVPLYAVSTLQFNLKGNIFFLEIINNTLDVFGSDGDCFNANYLANDDLGSMFGYALAAADINQDGLSELIVGAPAQPINNYGKEIGAIHIYIGGETINGLFQKINNDVKRMRTIFGKEENGRFGSAIATSDIDGDKISEIFVSAPYENSEAGIVYVISGFELNQVLLGHDGRRQISLLELERTQQLRGDSGGRHFGFSLQVVRDIDDNGCDELAIGSPANSMVRLLRCLPTVTAFTKLKLLGDEIIEEDANQFVVEVCLNVTINQRCNSIIGSILVTSQIDRNTSIPAPTFVHELTTDKEQKRCEIITVFLKESGKTEYTFTTNIEVAKVDRNGDRKHKAYKPWAVLSSQSKLENSISVKQYCTGIKCKPKLSYEIVWNGTDTIDTAISATPQHQSFVIRGMNTGAEAKKVSLRLFVKGARISHLTNQCFEENGVDEYSCALPSPLKQDSSYAITVWVNTTEVVNVPNLEVTAQLHDDLFIDTTYYPMNITVPFKLDTNSILVEGRNHNLNITDKNMQDSKIVSFNDNHEYSITNNGAVTWQDLTAILEIKKAPFIQNVEPVTTENCVEQTSSDKNKYLLYCKLTLKPGANKKIVVSFNISKKNIESDIGKKDLNTNSKLSLMLQPTDEEKYLMLSTQIHYQEILSVGNNLLLIMVIVIIVALVLLLILTFVLYKCGFFKREEKKKLDILRETVRKRSIRQASVSIKSPKPSTADESNCEIEVVDDCVFQEVDTSRTVEELPSSNDDVELIKDSPKVKHSSS